MGALVMSNRIFYFAAVTSALSLFACSGTTTGTSDPRGEDRADAATSESTDATESSGGTSKDSGPRDAGPPAPTGPVRIKNFSVAETGTGITMTFAIENGALEAIDRVQEVNVTAGKGKPVTFPISCQSRDWLLPPDTSSGVIELELGGSADYPYLRYDPSCGSSYSSSGLFGTGSSVTVELKGLLEDATPWKAQATAQLE